MATPCDKCQWGYGHGVNGEEMALDLELNDNGVSQVESKAEKPEAGYGEQPLFSRSVFVSQALSVASRDQD